MAWGRGLVWRGSHRRRCLGARRRRPEGGRCSALVKTGGSDPLVHHGNETGAQDAVLFIFPLESTSAAWPLFSGG